MYGEIENEKCIICGNLQITQERYSIRSNVRRFREEKFDVWQCTDCNSIHGQPINDLDKYYMDYPIQNLRLGFLVKFYYSLLLKRLKVVGLQSKHTILDYGCGNGLFLKYLQSKGFTKVSGYDPYSNGFTDDSVLDHKYDCVISSEVIEHVGDPRNHLHQLHSLLASNGLLFLGTPNAEGIDLVKSERHLLTLHQPFHQHILSKNSMLKLAKLEGFSVVYFSTKPFYDHWFPFLNIWFISTYVRALGNDVDILFERPRPFRAFINDPKILFLGLFGCFFPGKSKDHMTVILRKN